MVTLHYPRVPFTDDEWQLFHLAADPTQIDNLADRHPERVRALSEAWEAAAWENEVFPLDDGVGFPALRAPGYDEAFTRPVTIVPGTPTLERWRSAVMVQNRSFTVTARLAHRTGDQGVLVAHGDQGGGYLLYVEGDELHYVHNGYGNITEVGCGPLGPGEHDVVVDFAAPGERRWDVTVSVDGDERARVQGLDMLLVMSPLEGINVGIDRRSPVSWDLRVRHGVFRYIGDLHGVTYAAGEYAPDAHQRYIEGLVKTMLQFE